MSRGDWLGLLEQRQDNQKQAHQASEQAGNRRVSNTRKTPDMVHMACVDLGVLAHSSHPGKLNWYCWTLVFGVWTLAGLVFMEPLPSLLGTGLVFLCWLESVACFFRWVTYLEIFPLSFLPIPPYSPLHPSLCSFSLSLPPFLPVVPMVSKI